jgi:hypothetical protein
LPTAGGGHEHLPNNRTDAVGQVLAWSDENRLAKSTDTSVRVVVALAGPGMLTLVAHHSGWTTTWRNNIVDAVSMHWATLRPSSRVPLADAEGMALKYRTCGIQVAAGG